MSFIPTQRKYAEFWSNEVYTMFQDSCTHEIKLISDKTGKEINAFYLSAFTTIEIRFWDKSQITLQPGQFIETSKLNPVTHKKFFMQKRFSAIN